jgi:hypothetical protein
MFCIGQGAVDSLSMWERFSMILGFVGGSKDSRLDRLTRIALDELAKDKKVFATYFDVRFHGTSLEEVDPKQFIAKESALTKPRFKPNEAVLLISDAHTLVPARWNRISTSRTDWLVQAYKCGFDLACETTSPKQIDKRLRNASRFLVVGEVPRVNIHKFGRMRSRLLK